MTAEVAILNREAVAMAADSAATMSSESGHKILTSANKVFALSKYHPVGIMIYGSALFMGIPWETIIKLYRKDLADGSRGTLREYAEGFIEFIKNNAILFPEEQQSEYVSRNIYGFFNYLRGEIQKDVKRTVESKGKILDNEVSALAEAVISTALERWKKGKCNIIDYQKHHVEIKAKYKKDIGQAEKDVFEKLPLSPKSKKMLADIAAYLFVTFPEGLGYGGTSGVVISGFGENDIFPSLVSFLIEGMANNVLKYTEDRYQKVDFDNSAIIMPFAQIETVATFIDGISPLHNDLYGQMLNETVEKYPEIIVEKIAPNLKGEEKNELLKNIRKIGSDNLKKGLEKIQRIQDKNFVHPILSVVTFLSKNELAEMAESLVNLTILRKKISLDEETVGGDIDVAVISKGDGLIWIKRKHYFKPELNKHFFINYLNK